MCTPTSQNPLSSFWMERASSKSLASAGSMVKVGIFLKSRRLAISSGGMAKGILLAASSTFSGYLYGKPYSANIACISVVLEPASPSTSIISANGLRAFSGQSKILAMAFWPFLAPFNLSWGIKRSNGILLLGTRNAENLDISTVPTTVVRARSTTSTTSPSGSLFFLLANNLIFTLSPSRAWFMLVDWIRTVRLISSQKTLPNPL